MCWEASALLIATTHWFLKPDQYDQAMHVCDLR